MTACPPTRSASCSSPTASSRTRPSTSPTPSPRRRGALRSLSRFRPATNKPVQLSGRWKTLTGAQGPPEPLGRCARWRIAECISQCPDHGARGGEPCGVGVTMPRVATTTETSGSTRPGDEAGRSESVWRLEARPAQSVGTLVSVNVGLPKNVSWRGRTVFTGVFKDPVTGPRRVGRLNVDGDGQGDLAGHGGEQRAVFVYQLDSYRYWERELERDDFVYGQFGENFTIDGLNDDEVCIGDRYRIGGALFEVTQPRVTCYRVGIRMNDPAMAALLVSHKRPGFYFRVIEEGEIGAGDEIVKVADGPERTSVAEVDAMLYLGARNREQLD